MKTLNDLIGIGKTVQCPVTRFELYLESGDGAVPIRSYGICRSCDHAYDLSQIHFPSGIQHAPWAVVYEGVWCKLCYQIPNSGPDLPTPIDEPQEEEDGKPNRECTEGR